MPEQEAIEFEAQYFSDDDLFEEMTSVENELIDSFVRGELAPRETQGFQEGYLTSQGRHSNVAFAKALSGHLSDATQTSVPLAQPLPSKVGSLPFWQLRPGRVAFAAIGMTALIVISWLAVDNLRLRRDVNQLRAQQSASQQREQDLRQQLVTLNRQQPKITGAQTPEQQSRSTEVVSLVLVPGIQRTSGEPKVLLLSQATRRVRLQLLLEHDDYSSYRASVETSEGIRIWQKNGLASQPASESRAINLDLPAQILKSGECLVRLAGATSQGQIEDVADYHFNVANR